MAELSFEAALTRAPTQVLSPTHHGALKGKRGSSYRTDGFGWDNGRLPVASPVLASGLSLLSPVETAQGHSLEILVMV